MIHDKMIKMVLSGWNEVHRHKKEKSLAVILISIVLVFLLCHSLKLYLAFYKVNIFGSDRSPRSQDVVRPCVCV